MTSRERLTRLFNSQEIDRVPIWLLAPYRKFGAYADIYNIPSYKKVVDVIEAHCDSFARRNYQFGFCFNANPEIKFASYEEADGNNTRSVYQMSYKDFTLKKWISRGPDGTKVKFFLDDINQLQQILEIPHMPGRPDVSAYKQDKEEVGERGLMMPDIGDPLGPLHGLMAPEDFSVASITDYDKILNFTDEMNRRSLQNYQYLLEQDIGEVFFIVGSEFAGPPLVAPSKFNDMVTRYVKGIVDLIRVYGKKSIVHYHGNLYKVLAGMKEINPDGLHTIEAPPIGDCSLSQAREALGNMVLIGNIQYDDITRKEPTEIEEMVRVAIEAAQGGRFILSPTAGPYEAIISERTQDNYVAFVKTGLKYGKL
jgi:hypothetical protein